MIIFSAPILVSLLTLALLTTLTTSHIIHNFCETTTKYHFTESSHDSNLNLLLSSLISNTPKTGFSTATEGDSPYQIYGLALCRGDISDDICTSCLNTASSELQKLCPSPNGGMVWYNHCAVRYSIRNFFSQLPVDNDPNELSILKKSLGFIFPLYSRNHCTCNGRSGPSGLFGSCTKVGPSNPDQFKKNLRSMFESISKIAAFNESARMFATGVNAQTYGMVQCTRDLSEQQCYKCLKQSFSIYSDSGCGMDGTAGSWSCILMYSRGKFFNSDPTWVAPPDHYRLTTGRSNF